MALRKVFLYSVLLTFLLIVNSGKAVASLPLIDGFEATISDWTQSTGAGKGFQINTTIKHSGSQAIKANNSIGDGMYRDFTSNGDTLYIWIWFLINASSIPSGQYYDVRIIETWPNTTGKGLSLKWNTGSGSSSFLSIFDEWYGTEKNGVTTITLNVWHEIFVSFAYNNASGISFLYLDDVYQTNYTKDRSGYRADQIVLCQNDASGWDWFYDDLQISYTLPSPDVVYPKQQINEGWYNFGIGLVGVGLIFAGFVFLKIAWMNGEYDKAIAFPLICWVIAIGLITVLVGA